MHAGVTHPNDLDPEVRKDTEQIPPPLPGAVVPSIGAALDCEDSRNPDDIRISQREKRLEVAPVERLDAPPVKLYVLLRHRLLREPGGGETIGPLLILLDAAELAALDHVDVSQLHVDWNPAFCSVT